MIQVAAIMPCRGRPAQTVENVRRLLATAGHADWELICYCDQDRDVFNILNDLKAENDLFHDPPPDMAYDKPLMDVVNSLDQIGYWRLLQQASEQTQATHLINLANDLWACDDWLKLAVAEYQQHFGQGDGLLGFAGDGHPPTHSCHFLISRSLIDRYGGWPVWYQHNFGDAELCVRAQQDGLYHKSNVAWLEHCHPLRGQAPDDAVYQAGRATYARDQALYLERRRSGWATVR